MIHKHIKSLPHHPKRVIVISLILALAIGIFGYIKINKAPADLVVENTDNVENNASSHNLTLGFLSGGRIKTVSVKTGDMVKKGQILATIDAGNTEGALAQARAAYATAQANYQKTINGATSSMINVARAGVNTAQVNLDGATKQQNVLVENAYKNLLNSTPEALPSEGNSDYTAPIISGNYNKEIEGQIIISVYYTGNSPSFSVSGIVNGDGFVTTTPQPIGDSGLYIRFPNANAKNITKWTIDIPNKNAPNYLANYNAYQSTLQTKTQTISNAQAVLDQANASLAALLTSARPEDILIAQAQVDNARGVVQTAEAAYQNTIISAPSDGVISSVAITPGQIAVPNVGVIEFKSVATSN
jgi:multidrug efflux pump subunit AcrA (membrane-fusion protein)